MEDSFVSWFFIFWVPSQCIVGHNLQNWIVLPSTLFLLSSTFHEFLSMGKWISFWLFHKLVDIQVIPNLRPNHRMPMQTISTSFQLRMKSHRWDWFVNFHSGFAGQATRGPNPKLIILETMKRTWNVSPTWWILWVMGNQTWAPTRYYWYLTKTKKWLSWKPRAVLVGRTRDYW